ncbi:MAG: hypothetical protein WC491_02185 [Candidatus Omnitrophota bacterium]
MKKALFAVVGIMLVASSAFSYTINDNVNDQIGVSTFDIYGIDITNSGGNLVFDIYTNYPQSGLPVGSWNTFSGDLALSVTDSYDWSYGIALTDHDGLTAGTLYSNAQWYKSNDYEPASGGYTYNKNMMVTLSSGSVFGVGSVAWQSITGSPDYKITVSVPYVEGYTPDFMHTYMASATCANDFVGAPEPVSTILFIAGGTVLLARRMRKAKK